MTLLKYEPLDDSYMNNYEYFDKLGMNDLSLDQTMCNAARGVYIYIFTPWWGRAYFALND